MAKELADAIVEASIRMQKKEEQEALVVAAYVMNYGSSRLLLSTVDGSEIAHSINFFSIIDVAHKKGYRQMQGAAAEKLLKQANFVHQNAGIAKVHAIFQKV